MNQDMVKVHEVGWWTDLRDGEVDSHFLARKKIEDSEVGGERPSLRFSEISNSATARKVESELCNDAMEKEYSRRNYL